MSSISTFLFAEYKVHDGRQIWKQKEDHIKNDQDQGQLHILNKADCDLLCLPQKTLQLLGTPRQHLRLRN